MGPHEGLQKLSALDTKAPSKMASFTFAAHGHTTALQPMPVLSQAMPLEASEEPGLSRAAVEGPVALQMLTQTPCWQAVAGGGGGWLAGRQLALQPETNIIYLGRVGGCLLGVISQALGGPFQAPKYLLHLLPAVAVPDKNSFLFPS